MLKKKKFGHRSHVTKEVLFFFKPPGRNIPLVLKKMTLRSHYRNVPLLFQDQWDIGNMAQMLEIGRKSHIIFPVWELCRKHGVISYKYSSNLFVVLKSNALFPVF